MIDDNKGDLDIFEGFEIKELLLKKVIKEELEDIKTPNFSKLFDKICKSIDEE